jgi:hypothetical protein
MDLDRNIPVSTLTHTFSRYSKRATTSAEKNYLYQIVEAVGTAIPGSPPGFHEEFMKACGVSPEWGTLAA